MDYETSDSVSNIVSDKKDDAEVRKQNRQLRTQQRYEAAEKNKDENDDLEKKNNALEQTIEESDARIAQIFLEGKELITNIRVASDAREMERRKAEAEARNARLNKLEEEAEKAVEKIKSITAKWANLQPVESSSSHHSSDPLDLHQDLIEQKDRCLELIDQKNRLIDDFKWELKLADEQFMADREQMMQDISMLAQRIDEQVAIMKKSYSRELKAIEEAANISRNEVSQSHLNRWEELYQEREQVEVSNLSKVLTQMEENEEEIRQVHEKHDEHFRETKIRLENDVKLLEDELERIKSVCLLNSEKLDYNYQVLKKREGENAIIKTEQKRKINKLQGEVLKTRKLIEEKKMKTQQELNRLEKEVCALRRNLIDIEKKADHFCEISDRKYFQIWDLKTDEALELVDEISKIDRIIHEEILGLVYDQSDTKPLKKEDLMSFQSAIATVDEIERQNACNAAIGDIWKKCEPNKTLLEHLLSLLADETKFLQEEKLDILLEQYGEKEKLLVRLDNVLSAVGLTKPGEIELLVEFLLPYCTCPICESDSNSAISLPRSSVAEDFKSSNCSFNHPLMIPKIFLLKGLRDFVTHLHQTKTKNRVELVKERYSVSRMLSQEDVETYWNRFLEIFPAEELKIWDFLQSGLTDYHAALQERQELSLKEQNLRRQNAELKLLVNKYVPKKQLMTLPSIKLIANSPETSISDNFGLIDIIRKITE